MERNEPDRLYIPRNQRETYQKIVGPGSPLEDCDARVAFMMAVATGYAHQRKTHPSGPKDGYVRTEYLRDRDRAFLCAIAVERTGSLEVLADMKKVFEIAESYAAAGASLLAEDIDNVANGPFEKRLEMIVRDYLGVLTVSAEPAEPRA
jgi:hypothetical protein